MADLIFSINAVLPIVLMVLLGYLLKRIGMIPLSVASVLNRLVFRVFLPAMLFLNVYKIQSINDISFGYILFTVVFICAVFLVTLPIVMLITKDNRQRGPLLQGTFRSNFALVGIPLATSLFGEEGGLVASMLSAFVIPLLNVLAVVALSIFGDRESKSASPKRILMGILKNPLIQSIALGGVCLLLRRLFLQAGIGFRLTQIAPLYSVLGSLSSVATPLALVTLGAQFEFSAIPALKNQILWTVLSRGLLVPAAGLSIAYAMGCFQGAHFAAFLAVFATPVAVSSVPMAQEMNSDVTLAGQMVVWSTLVSGFTVFFATLILKSIGVFG